MLFIFHCFQRELLRSYVGTKWMEQDFLDLVINILTEKHQSNDLQWCETHKLIPFDVEIEQVCSLLLFLGIGSNLFDRPVDQVLGVPVNSTEVFSSHHLVVAWDATVTLFLIFKELFAEKLEKVRMRGG